MYGLGFSMKLSPASIQIMDEFAQTFSEKVQRRVFKRAGMKAAEAMVERVKSHMPYNDKPRYSRPHMRDVVAFKVKAYPVNGRTLFIVGYRSNTTNLQTLVENGNFLTRPRKINHESNSGRVNRHAGFRTAMVPKQRRDGSWRSVREQVRRRDNRRSTGSRRKAGIGVSSNMKSRISGESRGNFPKSGQPYAPITTAAREMRNTIIEIMETEIAAGFSRAFAREAGVH